MSLANLQSRPKAPANEAFLAEILTLVNYLDAMPPVQSLCRARTDGDPQTRSLVWHVELSDTCLLPTPCALPSSSRWPHVPNTQRRRPLLTAQSVVLLLCTEVTVALDTVSTRTRRALAKNVSTFCVGLYDHSQRYAHSPESGRRCASGGTLAFQPLCTPFLRRQLSQPVRLDRWYSDHPDVVDRQFCVLAVQTQ